MFRILRPSQSPPRWRCWALAWQVSDWSSIAVTTLVLQTGISLAVEHVRVVRVRLGDEPKHTVICKVVAGGMAQYASHRYPQCTAVIKSGVAFAYLNRGRLEAFRLRKHYLGPEQVTWPPLTTPRVASAT